MLMWLGLYETFAYVSPFGSSLRDLRRFGAQRVRVDRVSDAHLNEWREFIVSLCQCCRLCRL
jgi:hypothetical protein